MRHFFAAWWKARTRREGHTWGKGDPRSLLSRALSTPGSGTRGCTPRVFRCSRANREADRARPAWLYSEESDPIAGPRALERGPRPAAPRAQGASRQRPPEGAAAAREGWLGECRLPPSRGGNVGAPSRGPTRLGLAGRASHSHPAPALRALHRIALFRAPPRGQLQRGTAERAGLREPGAGGRVRRVPKEGWLAGIPTRVFWLGSQLKNGFDGLCRNLPAPASNPPPLCPSSIIGSVRD